LYHVAVKNENLAGQRAATNRISTGAEKRHMLWILVLLFFVFAILSVWSRAKVVSLGYEISRESRHLQEVSDLNEKLKAEVAMLKSPGRLEPIAKKKFGLLPPRNHQIVFLK